MPINWIIIFFHLPKRSDGKQMLSIVKRLVDSLHAEWQETLIIFRGDSHFAYPVVMNYIEATENAMYVTGLTGDSRLKKAAEDVIGRAVSIYVKHGKKAVLFHSFYYQAGTWDKPRRVIVKAEVTDSGKNIRHIVTDMEAAKASVLHKRIYRARGEDELHIKDHKSSLHFQREC